MLAKKLFFSIAVLLVVCNLVSGSPPTDPDALLCYNMNSEQCKGNTAGSPSESYCVGDKSWKRVTCDYVINPDYDPDATDYPNNRGFLCVVASTETFDCANDEKCKQLGAGALCLIPPKTCTTDSDCLGLEGASSTCLLNQVCPFRCSAALKSCITDYPGGCTPCDDGKICTQKDSEAICETMPPGPTEEEIIPSQAGGAAPPQPQSALPPYLAFALLVALLVAGYSVYKR